MVKKSKEGRSWESQGCWREQGRSSRQQGCFEGWKPALSPSMLGQGRWGAGIPTWRGKNEWMNSEWDQWKNEIRVRTIWWKWDQNQPIVRSQREGWKNEIRLRSNSAKNGIWVRSNQAVNGSKSKPRQEWEWDQTKPRILVNLNPAESEITEGEVEEWDQSEIKLNKE